MTKRHLLSSIINFQFSILLLLLASCSNQGQDNKSNDGTVEFRSPKGDIVVLRTIKGSDTSWVFNNALGEPLIPGCDSVQVIANATSGQPEEALFHRNGAQTLMAFWENMEKKFEGNLKDGLKEGHWTAYDMNTGKKQSETDFANGLEHGSYTVYNYNGTPRVIGQYNNGTPTGEWSFYDQDGNFAGTKKY